MNKTQLIKDSIRRFSHLGSRTIAQYILHSYGEYWDNNLEKIRSAVRYHRGKYGDKNRNDLADKSLIPDKPLKMPKTWKKEVKPYELSSGLWLVLSDIHVPFHEPLPIEAAIQAGQKEKVDGIFLNGDFQDCAAVSYWRQAKRKFSKEIEASIDMLDFLRGEFPEAKIVYKPGNHEYRLPSYYVAKAPELIESPVSAMEAVIGFEERNIEFLDYFQLVYAGMLPIIHGHEIRFMSRAVNPARGLFLKAKTFSACSHCHTTSQHTAKTLEGKDLTTWSFGCLCDLSPDWNPYGNDWNWGFGIINIENDGNFEVVNRRVLPSGDVV